jgi:glutathione-regulated potassium-efflux system protein KefB
MGRAALEVLGLDPEEIDRVDFEYRQRDCERLELQSQTGDLRAGLERSFAPDRALPKAEG